MANRHREILDRLRLAFPQPVSDRVHDSYFVHSIMRAIDQVDALKTVIPLLGVAPPNDYAAAQTSRLRDEPAPIEQVTAELVDYLVYRPKPARRSFRVFRTESGFRVTGRPPSEGELEAILRAAGVRGGQEVEIGDEVLEWE